MLTLLSVSPAVRVLAAAGVVVGLLTGCGEAAGPSVAGPAPSAVLVSPTSEAPDPTVGAPMAVDDCPLLPIEEQDRCYADAGGGERGDEFGEDSGGETDLSSSGTADLGLGLTLTELDVSVGSEDGNRTPNDPKYADHTFFHVVLTVRNDSTQPIDLSGIDAFQGLVEVFYDVNEYPSQSWATASMNKLPNRIAPGTTVKFEQDVSMPTPVATPVVVVFDSDGNLGTPGHRLTGIDSRFAL